MRGRHEEVLEKQAQTLEDLRSQAIAMACDTHSGLTEEAKETLRTLSIWLSNRTERLQQLVRNRSKISVTRLRLLSLQIERILDRISQDSKLATAQDNLYHKLHELLESQQKRDLYDDMIGCLRELSSAYIDRGLGREAAVYNDISQRLEARLESGHIDISDPKQRAKDEALYADFLKKLESLKR